eukprot:12430223-Karenia_brevis.AAC.1
MQAAGIHMSQGSSSSQTGDFMPAADDPYHVAQDSELSAEMSAEIAALKAFRSTLTPVTSTFELPMTKGDFTSQEFGEVADVDSAKKSCPKVILTAIEKACKKYKDDSNALNGVVKKFEQHLDMVNNNKVPAA